MTTIAQAFGEDDQVIMSWLALADPNRIAVLNEAIALNNAFLDAGLVDRGAMLGIKITMCDDSAIAETVLGERFIDEDEAND